MQRAAVGIDIGTTTSVVSIVDETGQPRCICPPGRSHLVPSAVYFGESVVVGEEALEFGLADPDGLAEGFKRDMGKPHYHRRIRYCHVPPEILTAFLIERMITIARQAIGVLESAVITVPAHFDEKRRTATQQAAQLAGVQVLDIINEPTAAAIAAGHALRLGLDHQQSKPFRVLVYDFGGGTFDVSLLEIRDRTFRTLATDGEINLGGRDVDERIANIVAEKFQTRHGLDPRTSVTDMQGLWRLSRAVKHELSVRESVPVWFQHSDLNIGFDLSRGMLEGAIEALIERSMSTTRDVLREAGLRWDEVDEFLLVGGSSRIPLVTRKAAELGGSPPRLVQNPDELISHGAALYAASRFGDRFLNAENQFNVVNVNAHSLGIEGIDAQTQQKINKILIPRNTPLPASKGRTFFTRDANQPRVKVRLLEGESENPAYCAVLGDCIVRIDAPLPKGAEIKVNCSYAADGTISVAARLGQSHASANVEIRRDGHTKLESLAIWRARLTTTGDAAGAETSHSQGPPENPPIDLHERPDAARILERLDAIYAYIGEQAADQPPPVAAIQSHRLVTLLMRETVTLKQLVQRLEKEHRRADEFALRLRLTGYLAQAKMACEQSVRLLKHSRIVLGRECVEGNVVAPSAIRYVDEAHRLQSIIEQLTE